MCLVIKFVFIVNGKIYELLSLSYQEFWKWVILIWLWFLPEVSSRLLYSESLCHLVMMGIIVDLDFPIDIFTWLALKYKVYGFCFILDLDSRKLLLFFPNILPQIYSIRSPSRITHVSDLCFTHGHQYRNFSQAPRYYLTN